MDTTHQMDVSKVKAKVNLAFESDVITKRNPDNEVSIFVSKVTNETEEQVLTSEHGRKSILSKLTKRPWQSIGIFAGAMVHISIGVIVALTGVILPSLLNPKPGEMEINDDQAYIFSSIVHAGSFVGSAAAGPLVVWKGQRISLLIFLPIVIISWVIIAFSQTYWLLITSRFISGTLAGLGGVCASNFVLEISHAKVKGRSFAILGLFRQLGFLIVYLIGSTDLSWRNVSLIGGLLSCTVPLALLAFLHDSPRWLGTKGRPEHAAKALQFYRGIETDISKELSEILDENAGPGKSIRNQLKLMSEGYIIKITIISLYVSLAIHFTGNMATVMYAATIFKSSNTGVNEFTSTIIMGVSRIVGTLGYSLFADKFPRRSAIIIPLIVSGICMIVLGIYFYLPVMGVNVDNIFWLPLLALIIYSIFICASVPSLMISRSELVPNAVRSIASSIIYMAYSLGAFLAALSFPYMISYLGSAWTFWFFALNIIIITLVFFFFVPETQGKSLEEIEDIVRERYKSKCALQCGVPCK